MHIKWKDNENLRGRPGDSKKIWGGFSHSWSPQHNTQLLKQVLIPTVYVSHIQYIVASLSTELDDLVQFCYVF